MKSLSEEALRRVPDLPDRLRRLMEWRTGLGGRPVKTIREVAELLAVTPNRARQLQARAESILSAWALHEVRLASDGDLTICADAFYGDIVRVRLYHLLLREGVATMAEAAALTMKQLEALPNIGWKSIEALAEDLHKLGLVDETWPEAMCPECGCKLGRRYDQVGAAS